MSNGAFTAGDVNTDGKVNLTDASYLFRHLFGGGLGPICKSSADFNGDNRLELSDGIGILNYLFQGGDLEDLSEEEEFECTNNVRFSRHELSNASGIPSMLLRNKFAAGYANGNITIAYYPYDGSARSQLLVCDLNGRCDEPQMLQASLNFGPRTSDIAVESNGVKHVVYLERSGSGVSNSQAVQTLHYEKFASEIPVVRETVYQCNEEESEEQSEFCIEITSGISLALAADGTPVVAFLSKTGPAIAIRRQNTWSIDVVDREAESPIQISWEPNLIVSDSKAYLSFADGSTDNLFFYEIDLDSLEERNWTLLATHNISNTEFSTTNTPISSFVDKSGYLNIFAQAFPEEDDDEEVQFARFTVTSTPNGSEGFELSYPLNSEHVIRYLDRRSDISSVMGIDGTVHTVYRQSTPAGLVYRRDLPNGKTTRQYVTDSEQSHHPRLLLLPNSHNFLIVSVDGDIDDRNREPQGSLVLRLGELDN